MKNSEFHSQPKDELLDAAKECQKSAQSLFETAEDAALKKRYGIANSLMILSAEECIKSAILLAGYFNVTLPLDVEPFFKDHKTKHDQAAEIQPVINFVWTIREVYINILRDRKSSYGTVFNMALTHLFATIGFKIGSENIQAKDFGKWWKGANTQKNNGFYVGFFNDKWNFPSNATEDTYLQTLDMARPFVESLQIVNQLKAGDNLLFSEKKEFTKQEMDESGIKLISSDNQEYGQQIDLSAYQSKDNSEEPSNPS
jgi:AbiV family abortive infection protein